MSKNKIIFYQVNDFVIIIAWTDYHDILLKRIICIIIIASLFLSELTVEWRKMCSSVRPGL